jgi:hypothetical protein
MLAFFGNTHSWKGISNMPIDIDHLADAFAAHHVNVSAIHDLHGLTDALSTIGIDATSLTPDQIDHVIHQIDGMLAQKGVQFAGNPGWYQGSSGTWYHNDPSGHYDGNWSNR